MPRAGVEAVQVARDTWAFIASPLRAIADMLYLDKTVTWKKDGLSWLEESLRIDEEDLRQIAFTDIDDIVQSLRSVRVQNYLQKLKESLRHAG